MYFRYFVIISPWEKVWPFIWTNMGPFHPCFELSLVEIGPVVLQKKILIFLNVFFYFVIISPWKSAGPINLIHLNPLYPKMLCAKFGWNWPNGSAEDFLILLMYFCYLVNIFPWKMAWHLTWTNLNSLHSRVLFFKFGWNWPSGSGEELFLISSVYLRFFVIISLW